LFRSASEKRPADERWQHFVKANAGKQMVAQGHHTDDVFVLCAGWAFRYIQLPDGSRQILKFILPGEIFSPALIFENIPAWSVKALTTVQATAFKRNEIRARCCCDDDLSSTVAKSFIEDKYHADRLLAMVAHTSAEQRIAYLLLHLMHRIAARSVIREGRYFFPLRQQHIADAVGLTTVHVSRVLGGFRDRRILSLADGVLQIINRGELDRIGLLS